MKLNKSTLYALYAALELSLARGAPITAATVAARHAIPEHVVAKVLAQLVRAELATASRGVGGGYRLAKDASHVTVQDVIDVFEPRGSTTPAVAGEQGGRLRDLFEEVDESVRTTFSSVSLATLAG